MAVENATAGAFETPARYVEWTPVIAGAIAAAALSFVLFTFGSSLGIALASSSPSWRDASVTLAVLSGLYVILATVASFGFGGYIAGQLRSPWAASTDTDEVEFRDGIHGLLVWALAVALGALLASVAAAAVAATSAPAASLPNTTAGEPLIAYDLDRFFRTQQTPPSAGDMSYSRAEAARIAMRAAARENRKGLPEDRAQLVRIVAARTGLTGPEAEARVTDFVEVDHRNQEGSSKCHCSGLHDSRGRPPWSGRRMVRGGRGRKPPRQHPIIAELAVHPLASAHLTTLITRGDRFSGYPATRFPRLSRIKPPRQPEPHDQRPSGNPAQCSSRACSALSLFARRRRSSARFRARPRLTTRLRPKCR
jgi:hypothetical protein